jgi:O-antigen/teichoic acid export membrane protein
MGSGLRLVKNIVALWTPNILNPAISFALILFISRYLGVEGLGTYSLVLSYLGIFVTLGALGLGTLVVREASKDLEQAHAFFVNAALFGFVSSLLAMLGMIVVVSIMGYENEVFQAAVICSFSLFASTAINYMEGMFRAFERAEYIAITFLAENILRVGICVILLLYGYGIVSLFIVFLGSRFFAGVLMFFCYVKVLGMPEFQFRPEVWRFLGKEAATFASIAMFSTIHLNIDQIMLSKLKSLESVGIFSAADRLLDFCRALTLAFAGALFPILAKQYVSGIAELRRLTIRSLRYLLLGTVPTAIGTAILSNNIITLVYGHKFLIAAPVLAIHIFSLVPFSMVYFLAIVLIVTDNQRVDLGINVVAALLNIGLNFALIPYFAEIGAALAVLITIVIFNQLQNWYIKQRLFPIPLLELTPKIVLAAGIMGMVTFLLRDWNLAANILVSAVVYASLVVLFKAVTPEEIETVKAGTWRWAKRYAR